MRYLRENTATRITVGPFYDVTDGVTPEIALTVTNDWLTFIVDDAGVPTLVLDTAPTASAGANDMVHITSDAGGYYDLELAAANVNYTGRATLSIHDTDVHLPVFHEFQIISANVYDSLFTDGDLLDVNASQGGGQTITAGAGITINAEVGASATAMDNFEDQYDTTGLTGDTFPATQAQIGNLSTGSGGISTTAGSFTKAGAEPETNTYTSTVELDGTLHIVEDDSTSTDCYYEFDVGTDGVPQEVVWAGYAQSNGDSYTIHFYNWAGTSWEQVGTVSGTNGTTVITEAFAATIAHVGTGANVGLVRFRFLSSDGTAFATDRLYCTYTQIVSGIVNGSTVTLAATTSNENFIGHNWILALGGQDISGSHFEGANVSGVASGSSEASFTGCHINGTTIPPSHLHNCTWLSTITLASAGNFTFTSPYSEVAGAGAPVLDMNSVGAGTTVNVRGLRGGLTVNNLTTNHTLTIGGTELGTITLNGADASVEIRGIYKALVNNLTGSPTVNTDGAILAADVAAILADTNELQTDDIPGAISALNNISAANVLTQVNAALDTAIAELGVAAPTATPTLRTGLMLMYMALRNRLDVDTTGTDAMKLYNDAGTQIASKAITDDGTDYSEAEMS